MLIQKFGGSSLADMDGFIAAAGIISRAAADEKVVGVLSVKITWRFLKVSVPKSRGF